MAYSDVNFQYDISKTLFEHIGLDKEQTRKYSDWEKPQDNNEEYVMFTEGFKNIECINFRQEYSHLCYWKGGHSLINNILDEFDYQPAGFYKSKLPLTDMIIVPYKDPLDKFISAYFTSHSFKEQTGSKSSDIFNATLPGGHAGSDVEYLIKRCYDRLDAFMNRVATSSNAQGFGKDERCSETYKALQDTNIQITRLEGSFDVHFLPIHVILLLLLQNYEGRFKLFGLNLDENPNDWIFRELKENPAVPQESKDRFLDRQSANNELIKVTSKRWKLDNPELCKLVIDNFLSNDYKLIEQLAINTLKDKCP